MVTPVANVDLRGDTLARLLSGHGRLFSEQLGIRLNSLEPAELFNWFVASLLFGARITESVAIHTYEAFAARGLLSPEALADADPWDLLDVMAEGGYVRYDGITSKKTQEAARKLLSEYGGDLNALHASASDARDLVARLTEFWGVGEVTAGIFLRELRGLWPKADPPLGPLARVAADHLGIAGPREFWRANAAPGHDFRHFEAALTRVGRDFCRPGRCMRAPIPHDPPAGGRKKDERNNANGFR
jgi:hypothetical protein